MELLLVASDSSTSTVETVSKQVSWQTGNWLTDKFYDPDSNFSEVSVDHTTEGFDEAKLVRIGDLAIQAA